MNKYDVGKLKIGMEVIADGKKGIVCDVHEPEWRCHKTKINKKEFQGADIRVDGQSHYYHADKITT